MAERYRVRGAHVLCLMMSLLGLTMLPAAGDTGDVRFSVTMVGEPGSFVGGSARLWRSGAASFDMGWREDGSVALWAGGAAVEREELQLTFAPPEGEQLEVGTYTNLTGDPFEEPGRAAMDLRWSDRGRCSGADGTFEVLEIDPATQRLWLLYELSCGGYLPPITGEVRINVPDAHPDAFVGPLAVAWPAVYPERPARPVPIRVVNTGTEPLTMGRPAIAGGKGAFSIEATDCATLAPAEECVVYAGFQPAAGAAHRATLTLPSSGPTWTVPLEGRGIPGHNEWRLRSSQGDPIGHGKDIGIDFATLWPWARGDASKVTLVGGNFAATFAAPEGRSLADPGIFRQLTVDHLDVRHWLAECSDVRGWFRIHESSFTADGELASLRVSFQQRCAGSPTPLFGSIAWRGDDPAPPLPPRVDVRANDDRAPHGQHVRVSATLERSAPPRQISLFAKPEGQPRQLLRSERLRPGESIVVTFRIRAETTFSARAADGRRLVAGLDVVRFEPNP